MNTQQPNTNAPQANSEGVNMQDIQALTSQVEQLASRHGFWNDISIWFIAASVLATAMYFFAQWMTNKRGNELNAAQGALIRAKDEQLTRDLKEKDDQIAGTYKEAMRIEAEANRQIADTKTEAQKEIARLTAESDKSREGIAIAQAQAATANEKAEAERLTRTNLEETLAPRRVNMTTETIAELKLFAGTKAFIVLIDDAEARRVSDGIRVMLQRANWEILGITTTDQHVFDGVRIETKRLMPFDSDNPPQPAAKILSYQLKDCKIDVAYLSKDNYFPNEQYAFLSQRIGRPELPDDTVFIEIGMKPEPYFTHKFLNEWVKQFDKPNQELWNKMFRDIEEYKNRTFPYGPDQRQRLVERQSELLKMKAKPPN